MADFEDGTNGASEETDDLDFGDLETITVTDEDGTEIEFCVVDELTYNGANYLLVVETESYGDEESEAVILKEAGQEGDEVIYDLIEDDGEFKAVSEMFSANMDDGGDFEIEL